MPILKQLEHEAFAPEDIANLSAAFEACLRELRLNDRANPVTDLVAAEIIRLVRAVLINSVRRSAFGGKADNVQDVEESRL